MQCEAAKRETDRDGGAERDRSMERDSRTNQSERNEKRCVYPVREGAKNCSFYMAQRWCKFGEKCWYNHPPDMGSVGGAGSGGRGDRDRSRERSRTHEGARSRSRGRSRDRTGGGDRRRGEDGGGVQTLGSAEGSLKQGPGQEQSPSGWGPHGRDWECPSCGNVVNGNRSVCAWILPRNPPPGLKGVCGTPRPPPATPRAHSRQESHAEPGRCGARGPDAKGFDPHVRGGGGVRGGGAGEQGGGWGADEERVARALVDMLKSSERRCYGRNAMHTADASKG